MQRGILCHGWGYPLSLIFLASLLGLAGCSDPVAPEKVVEAVARPEWLAAPVAAKQNQPPQVEVERSLIIGVVGPETGDEAFYGLQTLAGVNMAATAFNAKGGINGQPLEILHYDNQGDLASTEAIIAALIQKQVIAIIAAPTGWSTFAPTRLVNASRTIFMAVGTRRRIAHSGPFVFRLALPDATAVDGVVRYVVEERGYSRFALVISALSDHSLSLGAAFKQSLLRRGAEIILEADTYDTYTGQSDLAAVMRSLQKMSGAIQAVVFTGTDKEGVALALAMRSAGLQHRLIGGEDLFSQEFLTDGGNAVDGTLLFSAYSPERDRRFSDSLTALAFDAFTAIATAIGQAGSTQSSKVRDALLTTVIEGITGKTGFTEDGETIKQAFIYQVQLQEVQETTIKKPLFVYVDKTD